MPTIKQYYVQPEEVYIFYSWNLRWGLDDALALNYLLY